MTARTEIALGFMWRLIITAVATAVVTVALASVLSGAQRSLAMRVDQNTATILEIISRNLDSRNASLDALFCVIASGDFSRQGVDSCLTANDVPRTYRIP